MPQDQPRDLIVVPQRWGSTRLPGKPLVRIAGRTLLERTVETARRAAALAEDAAVLVATDDRRIADAAEAIGCAVTMTDPAISSGSGRACAAARGRIGADGIVVNLQGDAPFVAPKTVAALIGLARASGAAVVTPVVALDWAALDALRQHKRAAPFSGTTCVRAEDGRALWFSKSILPAIRGEAALREAGAACPVLRHVGLYGYRLAALETFEAAPPSRYEQLEGLEQLRFLELGLPIQTLEVPPPAISMSGIDTAEDVALAEALIARHGDPFDRP